MRILLKKQLVIILAIVFCIVTLGGCSNSSSTTKDDSSTTKDDNITTKDEIVVLLPGEPTTLDPAKTNVTDIGNVNAYTMEGLWYQEQDGTYSNRLVDKWEMADDKITLKVKLKEGVKFSDGSPLTAEDVLWSYIRASQSPISKSNFAFLDAENSKVIDDLNLIIKFKQPWSLYMDTLAGYRGYISSKKAYETMGEAAATRTPVGVGPYKISEWVTGSYIKLAANEYYYGGAPKVKNITLKFIPEPTSRLIELETGAADIAYNIDAKDIARANNIKGYHVVKGDSLRYFLICLSMQEPLFQNKDVRYAMTYAIDKKTLVNACTDGVGTPISTMAPPLAKEGAKVMPEIPYDVEKAKQLLAKAGYPDGFSIDLHVEPRAEMQRLAEAVQGMWAGIGIKANIVSTPLATYDAQKKGKFQASIRDGNSRDIAQIWSIYEIAFGSRLNPNDKVLDDKLVELKKHYPGDPERDVLLDEIAQYLYDIRFSYPFMTMPTVYAVSDKIEGFKFHGTTYFIDPKGWTTSK